MSKFLMIDTATPDCSVGLYQASSASDALPVLDIRTESLGQKHSERILALAHEICRDNKVSLDELDALIVGVGPGAFTGLRLAVGVSQGLAFGANRKVVPVSNLDTAALAAYNHVNNNGSPLKLWVGLDARQREAYVASYTVNGTETPRGLTGTPSISPLAPFSEAGLLGYDEIKAIDIADAKQEYPDLWVGSIWSQEGSIPADRLVVPTVQEFGQAMIQLGIELHAQGLARNPAQVLPNYVRNKVALTIEQRKKA